MWRSPHRGRQGSTAGRSPRRARQGSTPWRSPRRARQALAVAACLLAALPATAGGAPPDGTNQLRLERTVRYLQDVQNPDGGYSGRAGGPSDVLMTCWVALALAAAGINPQDQATPGGVDAWTYIERNTTTYKQTSDYERTLLAAVAAGEDGRDVGGADLIARILERQRPDGSFPQTTTGGPFVNATAFAILSLGKTGDPAAGAAIQHAADWLISHQNANGSWAGSSPGSPHDADMTGAVLQALERAGRHGGAGEPHALDFLRSMQHDDGGFSEVGPGEGSNTASTSWVVQGLWASGIDPRTWQRAHGNPLDYLASMQQPDGSIIWKPSQPAANPIWMTAYAAPAFAAVPLPVPAPARSAAGPRKPPTENGPGATAPDPQEGQGGTDSGKGGGVIAGGGGKGAPLFSRPQPQSQGDTTGGVRRVHPLSRRASERRAHRRGEQSTRRRQLTPAATVTPPPTATSNGSAASGVTPTPSAAPRPGAGAAARSAAGAAHAAGGGATAPSAGTAASAPSDEITGRVIGDADAGTPGRSRAEGIAPGLLGAQAGGDSSPGWAIGIVCGLVLCAGIGSQLDRRPGVSRPT